MMKNLTKLTVLFVLLVSLAGCAQVAQPPALPMDAPAQSSIDPPVPPAAEAPETASTGVYTVDITPSDFVEVIDNPFFFIRPGAKYIYTGESEEGPERIEVEILAETRVVMGVTATVVRDSVYVAGELAEDTFDWYAQDRAGNVWYLGEDTKEYKDGKVTSTAGTWEAGVDGALPGIIMYADPAAHMGKPYRQEYYQGEAEDMAEVINVSDSAAVAHGSFDHLLVIKEWSPLKPGVVEHKYYASGVGLVLEKAVAGGSERVELASVETNLSAVQNPGCVDDDDAQEVETDDAEGDDACRNDADKGADVEDDAKEEAGEADEANISPDIVDVYLAAS